VGILDGDAGPPGQDVFEMQSPLGDGGVGRFDLEVARCGRDRVEQIPTVGGQRQHLAHQRSVAIQQVAHPVWMQALQRPDVLGLVDQREVAIGAQQRHLLGDRLRNARRNVLRRSVDRISGHHPIRGVLAAGDRDEARCGHRDRMLPRQRRRLLTLPGQQRP
jgi:hypothetical protein